jgi:hypothetical protein
MRTNVPLRYISASLLTVGGLMLGGCASYPTGQGVPITGEAPAVRFNNGRVLLYVTDLSGRALAKAMVNVESADAAADYFRTAAFADESGRVSFSGLPEQVRISVYHAATQGNYSRVFTVPSTGVTELRMMVEPQ